MKMSINDVENKFDIKGQRGMNMKISSSFESASW